MKQEGETLFWVLTQLLFSPLDSRQSTFFFSLKLPFCLHLVLCNNYHRCQGNCKKRGRKSDWTDQKRRKGGTAKKTLRRVGLVLLHCLTSLWKKNFFSSSFFHMVCVTVRLLSSLLWHGFFGGGGGRETYWGAWEVLPAPIFVYVKNPFVQKVLKLLCRVSKYI